MNPEQIFTAILDRYEAISSLEHNDLTAKLRAYRKTILKEKLREDAELKGFNLTDEELELHIARLLSA